MSSKETHQHHETPKTVPVTRRDFLKFSAGTAACISIGTLTYGCGSSGGSSVAGYPIDSTVLKQQNG